jgi:hypothetical protein
MEITNQYTTEQLLTGIRYTFNSGHVLETNAASGLGSIEIPTTAGCGGLGGVICNTGDAFAAIRAGQPLPEHCKTW